MISSVSNAVFYRHLPSLDKSNHLGGGAVVFPPVALANAVIGAVYYSNVLSIYSLKHLVVDHRSKSYWGKTSPDKFRK